MRSGAAIIEPHRPVTDERSPAAPGETAEAGASARVRVRRGAFLVPDRWAALAMLGYLAVRLCGMAVLWAWARADRTSLLSLLGHKSDSNWYTLIVQHGYDQGSSAHSDMAFFPLYPGLVRVASEISPFSVPTTAVALSWLFALAAAWGLYAVGNLLHDQRTGILLAVLWGVVPHAVVESMAYTEGLFTALAAWTLFALLTKRWLTAAFLSLLAGLARPTASALVAVVCLAALIAVLRRQGGWRPWIALVLAPAGWVGYLLWVGLRVHRLDGWFHIQNAGWGSTWDSGYNVYAMARRFLHEPLALDFYAVSLVLVIAVALFAQSVLDRQPWQLLLFSALLLASTIGSSGYYYAKARFLLAAFPLLIPPAVALAKARTGTVVIVLATLTLVSSWFGGYLLLVWSYSP